MKYKYSKTAKQRKEERARLLEKQKKKEQRNYIKAQKNVAKNVDDDLTVDANQDVFVEIENKQPVKKPSAFKEFFSKKVNRITALALATIIGLVCIIVPIVLLTMPPDFSDTDLPVAEITLSNRKKLYFKLDYKTAPFAVNNFIFLAQEGFFNNTLIFDVQSGYVKIGGFTDFEPVQHRANERIYDSRLPNENMTKYGYRIRDDYNYVPSKMTNWGVLSTLKYDKSSVHSARTDFQICANEDSTTVSTAFDNTNSRWVEITGVPFGEAYDTDTLHNLAELKNIPVRDNGAVSTIWRPFVKDRTVRIKNVKIHLGHVEENKWGSGWNFYEVMEGNYYSYVYSIPNSLVPS